MSNTTTHINIIARGLKSTTWWSLLTAILPHEPYLEVSDRGLIWALGSALPWAALLAINILHVGRSPRLGGTRPDADLPHGIWKSVTLS
jgi:hypothetical protein